MNKISALIALSIVACNASATLITADLIDFSGAETVIDFNSVTGTTPELTNQFVSSGVTFSGGYSRT